MTKLPADAKAELPCACERKQPKPRDKAEVKRIKKLIRSEPEVLAYIEELEALWAYATRQGNVWRGIASAMGYEPKAHDSVKPTTPWLRERIIRYRRAALEQPDAEQGEAAWQPIETAPHGEEVLLYTPPTFGGQVAAKMEVGCASSGEVRGGYSNRSWHGTATGWQPLPEPPTPQVDRG
jgi:hypothetical protein